MVRWSGPAKADLKAIHDYIARDSKHYAKKITHELVEKTGVLAELPRDAILQGHVVGLLLQLGR